ncbi:hypothetical protein DH2020_043369 [Rehmannia glutinosa]|uniref:DNA topoisomerase n=1 Tax=Rehmannia glutinosa TaxID=99300 RepID=A0ABR0UJV7_REHGL
MLLHLRIHHLASLILLHLNRLSLLSLDAPRHDPQQPGHAPPPPPPQHTDPRHDPQQPRSSSSIVAEKPSIALAIATVLSGGGMSTRRGSTEVHEFDGMFLGFPVHYKVTSVIGHVFRFAITLTYKFLELNAPVSQVRVGNGNLRPLRDQVSWKLYEFSDNKSSSAPKALAVDARQEIDLKVGVAFTRFQTSYFNGKYGNLDSRVTQMFRNFVKEDGTLKVIGISEKQELKGRPTGLNTVNLMKFTTARAPAGDTRRTIALARCRPARPPNPVNGSHHTRPHVPSIASAREPHAPPSGRCRTRAARPNFRALFFDMKLWIAPLFTNALSWLSLMSASIYANPFLDVASSALGFGPQLAMQLAERLYTQGFISYPRTESTAYPSSFDYKGTLGALARNPVWGDYVQHLLSDGFHTPRSGTDAGDHPPITPMCSATENILGHDAWKLYQYICQHFLGTLSPDCKYTRIKIDFESGGELFHYVGQHVKVKGFTSIMPWLAVAEINIPQFTEGEKIDISRIEVDEGSTRPPDYLSESELISLMEKNGIGTDASISVHINNICERNYVQVQAGRRLVPTALGISLIRGYQCIDPDLCLPDIRSFIEHQISLVAKGQADHGLVVKHVIEQFKGKFSYFVKQIENMDALFEAEFSPLSDSGRVLSKCGKCLRYMKHISYQPSRLYCGTCEEIYYTPANGTIKLYKELTCPLDNFELLICSMPGPEGKNFPFCPYCYNSPPFEGIDNLFEQLKQPGAIKLGKGAGMPCFLCPHPTCQHSMISQGVCACPECDGTLVLDPISAPRWRLYCNMCNCLVSLPEGAHRISTTKDRCPNCDSTIIEVDFNKKTTPLKDGATLHPFLTNINETHVRKSKNLNCQTKQKYIFK